MGTDTHRVKVILQSHKERGHVKMPETVLMHFEPRNAGYCYQKLGKIKGRILPRVTQ